MQTHLLQCGLLAGLVSTAACGTFRAAHTEETKLPYRAHIDPLTRAQYTILEPVVTESCATQVALWPIPILFSFHEKGPNASGDGAPAPGGEGVLGQKSKKGYRMEFFRTARRKANEAAALKGLQQLEGKADVVYSPSFISEENYIRWWRRDVCVKVSTTGVHFKREGELSPEAAKETSRSTGVVVNGAGGSLRDAVAQ